MHLVTVDANQFEIFGFLRRKSPCVKDLVKDKKICRSLAIIFAIVVIFDSLAVMLHVNFLILTFGQVNVHCLSTHMHFQADPLQLQGFLQTLWAAHTTPDRLTGVPTKSGLNYGTTDPHQKSMHISADRQLPSAYPASLESLRINSQRLSRIPTKALELSHLTFLDLSEFVAH
jgi:hypothetical protein